MATNAFPIRTNTHQLEELSERYFRGVLPRNWTCEKPSHDYGVDLRVYLFEEDAATGLELLVQLKSATKPAVGNIEGARLKLSTYNHLRENLQVAMLVKYIEAENQAYWLLFRDIPSPPQDQKTFTVQIPKSNRLSVIDWTRIQADIREITDTKLSVASRTPITRRDM